MKQPIGTTISLDKLYKSWPEVKGFLRNLGCPKQDAEDIFQEALIILVRKTEQPDFQLTVDPIFYVRNTCKLLWYNQSRKERKTWTSDELHELESLEDEWWEKESKIRIIESAFQKIGDKCQKLLNAFYVLKEDMVTIAKKLDLRNDKVAKAQKYRCIQKVKDIVRSSQHSSTF